MTSYITWAVIFVLVVLFTRWVTSIAKQESDEGFHDTGLAILEFGRAFPNEAIRSLHATADGQAVFVRLYDNKAGFLRRISNHYACHLIEPGTVRVLQHPSGLGFTIEFLDTPFHNGDFVFATPQEAAEVSLWLLGNYVSAADLDASASVH